MDSQATGDFSFLNNSPTFKKADVKRHGHYLAGLLKEPTPFGAEITGWYDAVASAAAEASLKVAKEVLGPAFNEDDFSPAFRVKSASTIADKVNSRNIQLSNMQDFAGARLTVNCLHSDLIEIAQEVADRIKGEGHDAELKNYIESPQQGYRAIHVWVRASAGRVEIQFRTLLQSEWANAFERLADLTGRRIRYSKEYVPSDPGLAEAVDQMLQTSEDIHTLEKVREETIRTNTETLNSLADEKLAISLNPDFHLLRSSALSSLAASELERAEATAATIQLIGGLRRLQASLEFQTPKD